MHRVDESEARLVLPQRFARFAPELPNGLAFVKDADGMTERLQQVLITSRDIQAVAYRLPGVPKYRGIPAPSPKRTVDTRPNAQTFPNVSKQNETRLEQRLARSGTFGKTGDETPKNASPNTLNVSVDLRKEIIRLAKTGMSRRKIKDTLGLHGARYEIVRRVLDEAGL